MFDTNWELINGDDAHAIEVLNQSSQVNLIEALLRFLSHHDQTPGQACNLPPNQNVLQELHRTGTLLLLAAPGFYRTVDVIVRRRDGGQYDPPPYAQVPFLMTHFEKRLQDMWTTSTAVQLAAYVLWYINWVHPFKNGNGRTARAFSYTCVCLKYGLMLPGTSTMIDLVMSSRDEYENALAHADTSAEKGDVDLSPMEAYLEGLLVKQLSTVPTP